MGQIPFAVRLKSYDMIRSYDKEEFLGRIRKLRKTCTGSLIHKYYILTSAHCVIFNPRIQRLEFSREIKGNLQFIIK